MIPIHRKYRSAYYGDHLYTRDVNEDNSLGYVLEAENYFHLFSEPQSVTKTEVLNPADVPFGLLPFLDPALFSEPQTFTVTVFGDSLDRKFNTNLIEESGGLHLYPVNNQQSGNGFIFEETLGYFEYIGFACRQIGNCASQPTGSSPLYSLEKRILTGGNPALRSFEYKGTDKVLTTSREEAANLLKSTAVGDDILWECTIFTLDGGVDNDRDPNRCLLGWVPSPSSSEKFAEAEIKADILASELPPGEGITVDYFEIGTPNGMAGVDFLARNTLAGDDYAWLQRVEVFGSEEFPDRPFIDPLSDRYINGVDKQSDNLPFYDLGNNLFTEDSPRYFANADNFKFTAQTLLVKKLDDSNIGFVDGVEWGYEINKGTISKSPLVSLDESEELIGDFNETLALDFPNFRLVESSSAPSQSVPEPSGIINLILIACVAWRRIARKS